MKFAKLTVEYHILTFAQAWKRLIRFVALETNRVHLGQPVDSGLDGERHLSM